MRKNIKLLGAIAVAALAGTTSSAFTRGGLGSNPADQFVGGSVSQNIVGSTVTGVAYDTDEATNNINSITLTFGNENADGKTPTVDLVGGSTDAAYTCAAVTVGAGSNTSVCSPAVAGTLASNNATSTTITVA